MDVALRIAVIVGSTREGRRRRRGRPVVRRSRAAARHGVDLEVLDLAEFDFPRHYPEEATPEMTAFAAAIDRADGFVVVTPEYNRSFPASLKQAIDYAYDEWHAKPVGLRLLRLPQPRALRGRGAAGRVHRAAHDGRARRGGHRPARRDRGERDDLAVTAMLDQLTWWGRALRDARAARPYIA